MNLERHLKNVVVMYHMLKLTITTILNLVDYEMSHVQVSLSGAFKTLIF